jgi:plastocyanin
MRRTIQLAAIAGAVLAVAGCGGSSSSSSSSSSAAPAASGGSGGNALSGTVGPGFTISMDKTSVPAGSYTLTVDDQSSGHNFHLTGDGVDVKTEVSETGTKTFQITLKPGTYKFQCDPHASSMNGTLTVT